MSFSQFTRSAILLLIFTVLFSCSTLPESENVGDTQNFLVSVGIRYSQEELRELRELDFSYTEVTDSQLYHLRHLKKLETLKLNFTTINGEGLEYLAMINSLRVLELNGTVLDKESLLLLKTMHQLISLELGRTTLDDRDLAAITGLKKLERLDCSNTGITDKGLLHIAGLPELRVLRLRKTAITNKGLLTLKKLLKLKMLDISHTLVTNDGIADLGELSGLVDLRLENIPIDDSGLAYLSSLPLKRLVLTNTRITSRSFPLLKKMKHLEYLDISGTRSSYVSRSLLQEALPETTIRAKYMIFLALPGEKMKEVTKKARFGEKPSTPAELWLRDPLITGMNIPFKITLFSAKIKEDVKKPGSALVFYLQRAPFSITSGGHSTHGKQYVVFPLDKAGFSFDAPFGPVFSGTISADRVFSESVLRVFYWRKNDDNKSSMKKKLIYLAKSRTDGFFDELGGVFFKPVNQPEKPGSGLYSIKAGKEMPLDLYPYNHLGVHMSEISEEKISIGLNLTAPVFINGKLVRHDTKVKSDRFKSGIARIRVSAKKTGIYTIAYRNGKPFDERPGGTWNRLRFWVRPLPPVSMKLEAPEKVVAGAAGSLTVSLFDPFENLSPAGKPVIFSADRRLVPASQSKIYVNEKGVGTLRFIPTGAGVFSVIVRCVGKPVQKVIRVLPSTIKCHIKQDDISRSPKTRKITVPLLFEERHKNSPQKSKVIPLYLSYNKKVRLTAKISEKTITPKVILKKEGMVTAQILIPVPAGKKKSLLVIGYRNKGAISIAASEKGSDSVSLMEE
ncbi:MAG: hypothetical protein GY754_46605 [bacterium]|nr:hypothetical protein [bacterium]